MKFSRQEYPSPRNLPNPGIEPGFPALQEDSLPSELQGRYINYTSIYQLHFNEINFLMLKILKKLISQLRSTMETREAEKRDRECWRARSLHLKWGRKASLEKVTFEQRFEGREIWRHEGFWISGVKGIPGRKSKVKTLKCSWRNLSREEGWVGALIHLEALWEGFGFWSETGSHLEGFQQKIGMFWQHSVQGRPAYSADNQLNGAGGGDRETNK